MHEHDTDLIMSLAQGELDESAAAHAEAEIRSCARCSADFEFQRSALEAVAGAPRVYLTAVESARLRSAVRDELRLQPPAPAPAPQRRRRRFPLTALAGAAAVLLALVIAGPAFDLFDSGGEDSTATFDDALAPPDTEEATSEAESLPQATLAAPEPAPDAAAQEPEPSLAAPAPGDGLRTFGPDTDLEDLRALVIESGGPLPFLDSAQEDGSTAVAPDEGADRSTDQAESAAPPPEESARSATRLAAIECDLSAVTVADPAATPTVLGFIQYDGVSSVVVAYVGEALTDTQIVVLGIETCEVLAEA